MALPTNVTEANALDTNGDGQFSVADSPFAPYWPGDDYVDWVGLSVYYKGPNSQNINVLQPVGYCYGALSNYNPNTGLSAPDPWYETYCQDKPHVACMFAESGVAYHDMIFGDQGVSDLALKQRWWEDCLVSVYTYLSLCYLLYVKHRLGGRMLISFLFRVILSADQHFSTRGIPKIKINDAIRI